MPATVMKRRTQRTRSRDSSPPDITCKRSCPCYKHKGDLRQATNEELAAMVRTADCLRGWSILYPRMQSALAGYAMMLRGDADSADDLVQETLVRAWDNRQAYEPRYPYSPWVRTLMVRISTDWHRRAQAYSRMLVRQYNAIDPDEGVDSIDVDAITSTDQSQQLRTRLQMALTALSDRERTVILAWAEGAKPSEIAGGMNAKAGTVRGTLFRAKQRLAEAFHEQDPASAETER